MSKLCKVTASQQTFLRRENTQEFLNVRHPQKLSNRKLCLPAGAIPAHALDELAPGWRTAITHKIGRVFASDINYVRATVGDLECPLRDDAIVTYSWQHIQ